MKMDNRVSHNGETSGFGFGWNSIFSLLSTVIVLALLCAPLSAQSNSSEASTSSSQNGGTQPSGQSNNNGAPSQSGNRGTGTSSSQAGSAQSSPVNNNGQGPAQIGTPPASSGQDGNTQGCAHGDNEQSPCQSMNNRVTGPQERTSQTRPAIETHPEEPQEIRQPIPYGDLPSMRDLYTQVPSTGGKLQRFGSDAFLLGTGNANELPMDLPAGSDYVLGPGDALRLNMWGGVSNRIDGIIDRQGQIVLPEAGTIMVNGMTISQAQDAIQKALGSQFQHEHVEISL